MSKRVAESYAALQAEVNRRMADMPKAVNNGERIVPVAYEVTINPLVDDEDYRVRELQARRNSSRVAALTTATDGTTAFRIYTNAQRSDDGIGLSFMTPGERELARIEWSAKLRAKVDASDKARTHADRYQVVVDQDLD